MNYVIMSGNLVNDMQFGEREGKLYAYNKIGVYNGKNNDGSQRDSMFFDFVCFGRDAELFRDLQVQKGEPVTLAGRLEETQSTSQDGRTFINKRIVCSNVTINKRKPKVEVSSVSTTQDPFAQ
jgi:single-stranded DNA-binding protein